MMKKPFVQIFEDKTKLATKIPQANYLPSGQYPIVDQGQSQIAGYANDSKGLFREVPAIIFGDHTRIVKYVDEPFFIGADGVKVLKSTLQNANYKYLFYALSNVKIPNTGYNRHFKWLKESSINVPDQNEQKRIAERLDKVQELIALQKEQLKKLDDLIKSRFIDLFGDPITNPKGLLQKSMDEISLELFAGGDREQDLAKVPQGEYKYPVYSNGETRKGLLGYSKHYRVDKKAITISARGTIGFLAIREPFFTPVVRLITVVPKENINIVYLKYMLQCIKLVSSGTSQGQLTVPDFKRIKILLDSKNKQDNFADFVTKIEAQKGLLTARLSHLETLYKSLMQEYFG